MPDFDVIVIGAGCGGLTAGALLAAQGRRVVVLDQNDTVGGCASSFDRDGYRFDVGASIFEVIEPLERTFAALGTTVADEMDLIRCDPSFTVALRGGERLRFPASIEGIADAFGTVSVEDAQNWTRYATYCSELYEILLDTVYLEPMSTFADVVRTLRRRPALMRCLPALFTSYQAVLARYFSVPAQECFALQALTLGLPPQLLPGLFALIPYGELRGPYYPRGGMIELPRALRRVGERYGMTLHLNAPVKKIIVQQRRSLGVILADGTEMRSDVVVSNVNAKTLYQRLIDPKHLPRLVRRGAHSYRYDNACPMVYLGVDYSPPLDAHHTFVAPTVDELNTWWCSRRRQPIPGEQFGMIDWSTFSDPSLAPAGHHVLNVMMVGTYQGVDWDGEKSRFIDGAVSYLSQRLLPGLAEHVRVAACATPWDFERRIGLGQGGLHGITQDLAHMMVFRPSNKSKSIEHLYLAGSSTNPGGGVPTVIASGAIAAKLIERYER